MKNFTYKRAIICIIAFLTISLTKSAGQTASISPNTSQTTVVGGAISFTADPSGTYPGSGNQYSYAWAATGATISGVNPASADGNGNTKAITFPSPGTYTVSCTVSRGGISIATTSVTVNVFLPNLYSTSGTGTIKAYNVDGITGAILNGPVDIATPAAYTAGLSKNKANANDVNGNLYYILREFNNNTGTVKIHSLSPSGTGDVQVGTIDMNGANNSSLGFVRMGFDNNGRGWIIAGDGSSSVYIASFQGNGTNPISNVNTFSNTTLTVAGGSAADFQNGDLAITPAGTLYALANVTDEDTYIYTLNSLTSPTTLTKKWTVQTNNARFSGSVNGVAWTLTGSLHISTADGIFFVDQATANSNNLTVQATQVSNISGLTDLASSEFPSSSSLPVKFGEFTVTKAGNNASLVWTTYTELNNDHFEVERSTDAIHFQSVGLVNGKGTTSLIQTYTFTDPLLTGAQVIYYRIKQVDINGASSYSIIVALRNNHVVTSYSVYPNPFVSNIKLQIRSTTKETATIRISNTQGQVLISKKFDLQKGDNIVVVPGLNTLGAGVYTIETIGTSWKQTERITKY